MFSIQKSCFRKQSSVNFSFMRADFRQWLFLYCVHVVCDCQLCTTALASDCQLHEFSSVCGLVCWAFLSVIFRFTCLFFSR